MKKYFYGFVIFLFIGITLQSCQEDKNAPSLENQVTQQKANVASWNHVQQQLKTLDMSYGLTKNIRRAPGIPETYEYIPSCSNLIFPNRRGWEIARADAEGASYGSDLGSFWGARGRVIGAVLVGGSFSLIEYVTGREEYMINSNNPFIYTPQENRFSFYGTNAPIGSEIGDLHNCLIYEMLHDESFGACASLEDMFNYMCIEANCSSLNTQFTAQEISNVQAFLYQNKTFILANQGNWEAQIGSDEFNVIKHYAYVISQETEPFDMQRYTYDYMMLVDEAYQNNWISEESAIMINGTISTMYCSYTAWNYIQPDPYQTTLYAVNTDDMWYFVRREQLDAIIASGDTINFVGYPYIDNDTLKRIYVYANNSYNVNYANDSVMQILFDGTVYENETSDWTAYNLSLDNNPIPTGYYPIYPAEGYDNYVYIDIEQQ